MLLKKRSFGPRGAQSHRNSTQALENMGCRHPCRRHRHRRHCKTWVAGMPARVAGIPVVVAGTAGTGKRGCRHPLPPRRHRRPGLRGLQASLPPSQAPQTLQIMGSRHVCAGGRHPCRRRRHRRQGKTWVASILFLAAAIAGPAKRGLQASLPSSHATQTLQIMGCRHACVGCRHASVGRRHRKHCKSWVQACLPV